MESRSGGMPFYFGLMRKPYPTPEQAQAKRTYVARGQNILAGKIDGLFETGTKRLRLDVQALIEAALEKRAINDGDKFSRIEK